MSGKQMKTLLIIMSLACASLTLNARNYYVAPNGTGTGTKASPFGSINSAANKASAGDTIYISGGTYSEINIKPTNSGSLAKGMIVYTPWPGTGKVIIKKENNVSGDDNNPIFNFSGLSYIWVEGLTFKDMSYLRACFDMSQSKHCVITGCQFLNLGNDEVAPAWAGTSMIWFSASQDCVVSNCYFKNVFGDAINFYGQDTKRNLFCGNTFVGMKGKGRSWADGGKFSSAITGSDNSFGENILCFNHITKGLHGLWLDRDASRSILVRNFGNGGNTLVFNESRCAQNWIQENIAINMTDAGYRSASYAGTNWSFDTRYINNVAYNCKYGMYLHKSKHNEVRNNIVYNSTEYNLVMTDSACFFGGNCFKNNLWRSTTKNSSIQYMNKAVTPSSFGNSIGETNGIYYSTPSFVATNAVPSSYMLKATSPCIGAGDGGIDLGAYPLYQFSDMGCDTLRSAGQIQPYFETLVTEVLRGEQHNINVRLIKASSKPVTVNIIPVAGDALENTDYILSENKITFQPGEISKNVSINFVGEESDFGKLLLLRLCDDDLIPYESKSYAAFKLITRAEQDALLNTDLFIEAEDGTVGSLWQVLNDTQASCGKYVMINSGNNSSNNAPDNTTGWVSIDFEISRPTTYVLWLRTICPSANDDSFWLRLDNEEWSSWNGIPTSTTWQWNKCPRTYTMLEGKHTLHIGYREDGTKLDKLMFSCIGTIPEGLGNEVTSIYTTNNTDIQVVEISYFDLTGRKLSGNLHQGIVIKRIKFNDGTVKSEKIKY